MTEYFRSFRLEQLSLLAHSHNLNNEGCGIDPNKSSDIKTKPSKFLEKKPSRLRTESDYFPPPSSLLCLFTVGTEVQMDREVTFWKNIFTKSVLTIYPDPQSLGLDWSSRIGWGLFTKLKNHAITSWFRIALSAPARRPWTLCPTTTLEVPHRHLEAPRR